ncbi:hypothetical protein DY000_02024197 [Brassica cretica]|uniref:Pentacotripeptide-repeat region of PRORP domain-containing protein n=1 Tax=Brassica cretica TaxID=69181 RepID=A0ABQ7EB95_BRACR|nr:hypothetical protein DY000_02024197 [Brassica cretica]
MQDKYNMSPAKEHYGCMVDLLCRAGRLSEAEKIDEMPFEKDDVVWTTLLRACTAKRDVERGRRAAERVLEVEPTSSTALVTLANIYSSTGKWKEAAIVRKSMKSKGVDQRARMVFDVDQGSGFSFCIWRSFPSTK